MAPKNDDEPVAAPPKTGVAALFGGPFRIALVFLVSQAIVGAVVLAMMTRRQRKPVEPPTTLAMVLKALDNGDRVEAQRLALKLQKQGNLPNSDCGGPDYVLGLLAAEQANHARGKQRSSIYQIAAQYLEEAEKRGFPAGREAHGMYLLGKSLCRGGRLADSRPYLQAALKAGAGEKSELRRLLVDAYLSETPPQFEQALAECDRYLTDKHLETADRQDAEYLRAETFFRMDRYADCAAALNKIAADAPVRGAIAVLRGRLIFREAQALKSVKDAAADDRRKAADKFHAAIEAFRAVPNDHMPDNPPVRRAQYLIGLCLLELGDERAALTQLQNTAKQYFITPEGLAAEFQAAELQRRFGAASEAASLYRRLLISLARPDATLAPWVTPKQIRTAVVAAIKQYMADEQYDLAESFCHNLRPLFSRAEALEMTAEVNQAWAESMLRAAEVMAPDAVEKIRRQARTKLRHAGQLYETLAKVDFTGRRYPDHLWHSGEAYLGGHDFVRAARLLRVYAENGTRQRHAEGLTELGYSLISMEEWDKAMDVLVECIDQHPRDLATHRARLLASQAAAGKGDLKLAEAYLMENLHSESLTPASVEWRESLFALGRFLHDNGRYPEAIRRLEEAVARYPTARQALECRYLAADAARRSSIDIQAKMANEISSAVRAQGAEESHNLLEMALAQYQAIHAALGRRNERDLPPLERSILRNTRFAIGETEFDLGHYPEALRAYQSAANHYADRPEVLDAYMQIAEVFRRLDRPAEARTSLEQARLALRRLPPDTRFDTTTNYNRKEWDQVLAYLCSL